MVGSLGKSCGVGVGSTQWGDWLPNGITETRVLLGRALAPYCQTKQRQYLSEHDMDHHGCMGQRSHEAGDRMCDRETRQSGLSGRSMAAAAGQPPLNNHIPLL